MVVEEEVVVVEALEGAAGHIHQIMFISLFPTPFDHFHFHGSAGLVPKLILTPRPM